MPPLRVKICGITDAEQATAIAALGITTLGFICVRNSPRWIAPESIRAISQALETAAPGTRRIGVFAQADLATLDRTVALGRLTGVQLHGDESLEFVQAVRAALPEVELIKAVRVRDGADLAFAERFAATVDGLLLDAYHPQMLGGTGHRIDWQILQQFRPAVPWLLAGGLNPDNVVEALSLLQPGGIDLSSGVEHSPGDKDLAKVKMLCHNLRAVAQIA
jgi:phosphoribosylanthranilate isomerase